jgi:hypothetical protein
VLNMKILLYCSTWNNRALLIWIRSESTETEVPHFNTIQLVYFKYIMSKDSLGIVLGLPPERNRMMLMENEQ